MRSQIKLGHVFGIEIGLHYSWFLIAFLIVVSLVSQFHTDNPQWGDGMIVAMALTTGVLFFVSLLLHELAHSVFAQSHGMPVREITLFALGGVSQIEKNPTSARSEFWMAFVGPLTSAVIGGVCVGVRHLLDSNASPVSTMFAWLGYINLGLAAFNMMPAYPLDGGRILRAALWWKSGNVDQATRQAGRVGQVAGLLLILFGILQFFGGAGFSGLWLAFIGWFLLQSAGESVMQIGLPALLQGATVADIMTPGCPAVDGHLNVQNFVDQQLLHTGDRCFVVEDSAGAEGLVTPEEVKSIERARWPFTTLYDIMRPIADVITVPPDASLKTALEIMGRGNLNEIPVLRDHRVAGVLTRSQLVSFLHKRMELGS